MKMFGGVNFGPVGYWLKQVSNDANYGTSVLNGQTALPGQQLAIGATASTQFGDLTVQLMFTQVHLCPERAAGQQGLVEPQLPFSLKLSLPLIHPGVLVMESAKAQDFTITIVRV